MFFLVVCKADTIVLCDSFCILGMWSSDDDVVSKASSSFLTMGHSRHCRKEFLHQQSWVVFSNGKDTFALFISLEPTPQHLHTKDEWRRYRTRNVKGQSVFIQAKAKNNTFDELPQQHVREMIIFPRPPSVIFAFARHNQVVPLFKQQTNETDIFVIMGDSFGVRRVFVMDIGCSSDSGRFSDAIKFSPYAIRKLWNSITFVCLFLRLSCVVVGFGSVLVFGMCLSTLFSQQEIPILVLLAFEPSV